MLNLIKCTLHVYSLVSIDFNYFTTALAVSIIISHCLLTLTCIPIAIVFTQLSCKPPLPTCKPPLPTCKPPLPTCKFGWHFDRQRGNGGLPALKFVTGILCIVIHV